MFDGGSISSELLGVSRGRHGAIPAPAPQIALGQRHPAHGAPRVLFHGPLEEFASMDEVVSIQSQYPRCRSASTVDWGIPMAAGIESSHAASPSDVLRFCLGIGNPYETKYGPFRLARQ